MFHVWQAVQVRTKDGTHEREGEAGVVHETNAAKHPDAVVVNFDTDGGKVSVQCADLVAL